MLARIARNTCQEMTRKRKSMEPVPATGLIEADLIGGGNERHKQREAREAPMWRGQIVRRVWRKLRHFAKYMTDM